MDEIYIYSTLIRRAMVEAYCPTLVELVFMEAMACALELEIYIYKE